MIRPYKQTDKENLLNIFSLNTSTYFDKNEVIDFENHLEQKAETHLTIEIDNIIVGGTGFI